MSLFGPGRKRDSRTIHGIKLKVRSGSTPLPAPLIGAYVMAFSIAEKPRQAVIKSVHALQAMGYDFEEIFPEGISMEVADWGSYVAQAWDDISHAFPSQSELVDRLAGDGVVFGAFAGFETREVCQLHNRHFLVRLTEL